MKKLIYVLLSALLVLCLFSSCASKTENETEVKGNEEVDPSVLSEEESEEPASSDRTINGKLASFSAATLDGGEFGPDVLADFDLTVINFWGTYCGPCISEMEELGRFSETLPSNVNFITLCVDAEDNEETVRALVDENGFSPTVITYADGDLKSIIGQISFIPTTIFVDKNGSIVGSELVGSQPDLEQSLNSHIEAALAEIGA